MVSSRLGARASSTSALARITLEGATVSRSLVVGSRTSISLISERVTAS